MIRYYFSVFHFFLDLPREQRNPWRHYLVAASLFLEGFFEEIFVISLNLIYKGKKINIYNEYLIFKSSWKYININNWKEMFYKFKIDGCFIRMNNVLCSRRPFFKCLWLLIFRMAEDSEDEEEFLLRVLRHIPDIDPDEVHKLMIEKDVCTALINVNKWHLL